MSKKHTSRERSGAGDSTPAPSLRERAQARMAAQLGTAETVPAADDLMLTLFELRVHQIELEIQNDELQRAHVELAQARDRYVDLYEFAPAGFLTLDATGIVKEANLAAAAMLGCERR